MSWEYSENILVQKSAGDLLKDVLGWDVVYAYNKETLGEETGTLGRKSYKDIILKRYLRKAMFDLNDWLTDELYDAATKTLLSYSASDTIMQINQRKYEMLRDGIPVLYKKPNGSTEDRLVKIFNFNEPKKNNFLAVKEMKIHGDLYRRRTDIVGFVNGIPLLFIELKKQNVDVQDAYTCNYTDYLSTIPQLFHFNTFIMFSNGLEAKVGTLGSKYDFFHEWKRLKEDDAGAVDLETMLRGICDKSNFMDIFENFILYDRTGGKTAKILARNHQYLGVNETVEAYKNRKLKDGKLGVFWHTQGSGKSYSMVFLAQKIRRKFTGSPTFVILTDRDELNKQVSDTFEACGCLGNVKAKQFIASSGEDLITKLKGNPSYIFTLIHKFNQTDVEPIIPDHDIIIMSDEAHRTQNGIFADNMCALLPTASRIGFTGTPLFTYDNITERTFGGYVSVYDFKRAVEDGATVPLYYENRADMLEIKNPEINDDLLEAVEAADLDVNQKAKLELELRKDIHILTSNERLDTIAKDFVEHYSELWTTGKAMFVCVNKITAVRMYNLAMKYWEEKTKEIKRAMVNVSQQEYIEMERKLNWMKSTEMAVVISQEQNEIEQFKKWVLDIKFHREKMEKRELDKEFKDADNPFRIVFVCAMWLTGFDVQNLSTIYLDKPMKSHTLMQAIARANRVYEGKECGLIVDYINIFSYMKKALGDYATGDGGDDLPVKNMEELMTYLDATITEGDNLLREQGYLLSELIDEQDTETRLEKLREIYNALVLNKEVSNKFKVITNLMNNIYEASKPEIFDYHWTNEMFAPLVYLNGLFTNSINDKKVEKARRQLSKILDSSVVSKDSEEEETELIINGEKVIDLSKIDFDNLKQEFRQVKYKEIQISDIKAYIEKLLEQMLNRNKTRRKFAERYQSIIDNYNSGTNDAEYYFEQLEKLLEELQEEQNRHVVEGLSEDELEIYDLLLVKGKNLNKEEVKKVKLAAKNLYKKLTDNRDSLLVVDWFKDENTTLKLKNAIEDSLDQDLPISYDKDLFQSKTNLLLSVFIDKAVQGMRVVA